MAEIINPKEAETLRTIVGSLAKKVDELSGKVDGVVTAQGRVNTSLQEFATAKRSGTPVQFMQSDIVRRTIEEKLNSQLIKSTVDIDVINATIGEDEKKKIDGLLGSTENLITAANALVESNKGIKPRKPLLSITIHNGRKAMWFGVGLAGLFMIGMMGAIVWAQKKENSIQEQDFYWGNRAYQAALLDDYINPGERYHVIMSEFAENPEKSKEKVVAFEAGASSYHEKKQYLLSFIGKKDSRDIRVLKWEETEVEGWFLYRFYDEETERSVHVWPDKKVEETTNKIVKDLASAQKYSKRKIWTVIQEAPAPTTE